MGVWSFRADCPAQKDPRGQGPAGESSRDARVGTRAPPRGAGAEGWVTEGMSLSPQGRTGQPGRRDPPRGPHGASRGVEAPTDAGFWRCPLRARTGLGREQSWVTCPGTRGCQSWRAPGEEGKVGGPAGISEIQRSHYPGSVPEERAPCPLRPFPCHLSQLIGECCPCSSASCPSLFRALSEQVRPVSSGLIGCPPSRSPRRSVRAPSRALEHRVR